MLPTRDEDFIHAVIPLGDIVRTFIRKIVRKRVGKLGAKVLK